MKENVQEMKGSNKSARLPWRAPKLESLEIDNTDGKTINFPNELHIILSYGPS